MNIVLCGMTGCGKTTVAEALEVELLRICIDTDRWIEKEHGSIAQIFAEHGEEYFRDLETKLAKRLSTIDRLVIAVGGGLVLRGENVTLLQKKGKLVYLRAKKETLLSRLQGDCSRPLLQGDSLSARLDALLAERSALYETVADFIVDVDEKTPAEIAGEIIREFQVERETFSKKE